jgi:hypothetical protein
MNETDTPRTDEMHEAYVNLQHYKYTVDVGDIFDFSRKLERELAEITKALKVKRCEFCHELPQTENEKAYASEFGDKKGELPTMDDWLQNQAITQTEQTK